MRFGWIVILALSHLAISTSAAAQHADATTGVAPELSGCGMCHSPHDAGSGRYTLRIDERALAREASGDELGIISQSCLRCHSTAALRAQQPGFQGTYRSVAAGGKYLRMDLSDDHPLGWDGSSGWSRLDELWPGWDRSRNVVGQPPASGTTSIECTTCHDPHSRTSFAPEPSQEVVLCSRCHDPGRYKRHSHGSLACGDCHQLHGGHGVELLSEPGDMLCTACHISGSPPEGGRNTSRPIAVSPQSHIEPPRGSCRDCHSAHR